MATDFILNSNGDISFVTSEINKTSFQFDFMVSNNDLLIFDFYIENLSNNNGFLKGLKPSFILDFRTEDIKYDKEIYCNSEDEAYIMQQIKIRLSTPLSTMHNNMNIGSDLELYKHYNVDEAIPLIRSSISQAISDIIDDDTEIIINKINTNYFDYTNGLEIVISTKKFDFYYYL